MSKTEAVRFIEDYLPKHPDLKQRLGAVGDNQKLATELARAGADAGFVFSEAEILETLSAMPSAELSEQELHAVAGGTAFAKVTLEYKEQKPDGSLSEGTLVKRQY